MTILDIFEKKKKKPSRKKRVKPRKKPVKKRVKKRVRKPAKKLRRKPVKRKSRKRVRKKPIKKRKVVKRKRVKRRVRKRVRKPKRVKKRAVRRVKRRKVRRKVKKPVRVKRRVRKVKRRVKKKPKVKRRIVKKKFPKRRIKKPKRKIKVRIPEKIPDEKAFTIIKNYRIPVPVYGFCKNEKMLPQVLKKIGFPCVMKVSGKITHKTDVGGVITDVVSEVQALESFKKLMKIKGAEKVLIEKQLEGLELIVGSKRDPNFGHVIIVGLGGIYVEIFKDVSFRISPINKEDAKEMAMELKGYPLLKGVRGQKPINFEKLYDVLVKVSRLSIAKKIIELDINPLFCNDKGCWAADIRIVK
ncbi:MAG: acetate--CoA ligase family protein [Candidatus Aenigmatarchaeota archaeon]